MTMDWPGPEVLWARIAVNEALSAVAFDGSGDLADSLDGVRDGRISSEDGAGNWFTLIRYPDSQAILFGHDEDSSFWQQAYDPRADAPPWVQAADLATDHARINHDSEVTFVRWWDGSRWNWSEIAGEDGAVSALRNTADPVRYGGEIDVLADEAGWIPDDLDEDPDETVTDSDHLEALCAAADRGALTGEFFEFLDADQPAVIEYLTAAGIVG
ncbi:hypothetical protein [Nocardia mangyaensis]|uniref:hypothetical protein n=1 Tax=Nocardia mangyaensis TaxID=2213200 RepID=UPI002675500B|nr:hypothetical protein [Nocardia mangyaensis]MDO3649304.1 hypothetical protein [Nocardia mangyaensis]